MMLLLLVDDDATDREMIKRSLRSLEIEFEEATDCQTCLEFVKKQTFDLILLDYLLPDGNGLDLVPQIRALQIFTPIILITGHGSETLVVDTAKAGVLEYIPKSSITPEFLTRAVLQALLVHAARIEKAKAIEDYETMYKLAPIGLFRLNKDGVFMTMNDLCKFYTNDATVAADVFPKWDYLMLDIKHQKVKEREILLKNNRWMSLTAECHNDTIAGCLMDITARKNMEKELEALRAAEAKEIKVLHDEAVKRLETHTGVTASSPASTESERQ